MEEQIYKRKNKGRIERCFSSVTLTFFFEFAS